MQTNAFFIINGLWFLWNLKIISDYGIKEFLPSGLKKYFKQSANFGFEVKRKKNVAFYFILVNAIFLLNHSFTT